MYKYLQTTLKFSNFVLLRVPINNNSCKKHLESPWCNLMLAPSRPANATVVTSIINKRWRRVDLPTPRARPLLINVCQHTINKARAWKMPSCICSSQLCIKSEFCCGICWKLQRLLEAATGCQRGPQYDRKCSFYFNCYFFCTTPTNRDLRQKAVYFPAQCSRIVYYVLNQCAQFVYKHPVGGAI